MSARRAQLLLPTPLGLVEYDVLEDAVFVGPATRGGLTADPVPFPEAKVASVPFWVLRVLSWMPGRSELRHVGLPIMRYFTKVEEIGDAGEADALLGAPATTVREWSAARCTNGA